MFHGAVPADIYGPQRLYDFSRYRKDRKTGLLIYDCPFFPEVYRKRAFTIVQYFKILEVAKDVASKKLKTYNRVGSGAPGASNLLGRGSGGRGTLGNNMAPGTQKEGSGGGIKSLLELPGVAQSGEVADAMKNRFESSEFAMTSQKSMKAFLAQEQEKYDETMAKEGREK